MEGEAEASGAAAEKELVDVLFLVVPYLNLFNLLRVRLVCKAVPRAIITTTSTFVPGTVVVGRGAPPRRRGLLVPTRCTYAVLRRPMVHSGNRLPRTLRLRKLVLDG